MKISKDNTNNRMLFIVTVIVQTSRLHREKIWNLLKENSINILIHHIK